VKGVTKMLNFLENTKAIRSISEIFGKERRYRYIAVHYLTEEECYEVSHTNYQITGTKLKRKEVLAELIDKERILELDPSFIQRLSDLCIERGLAQTLLDRKTVSRLVEALENEQRIAKVTLVVPTTMGTNLMRIVLKHPSIDENNSIYVDFIDMIRRRRSIKKSSTSSPSSHVPVNIAIREEEVSSHKMNNHIIKSESTQKFTWLPGQDRLQSVMKKYHHRTMDSIRTQVNSFNDSASHALVHGHDDDVDHEYFHQYYSTPRRRITWELEEDELLMAAYAISKARFRILSWTLIAEFIEKKDKLQCQRRVDVLLRSPASSHKVEELMRKYEAFFEQLPEDERQFKPKTLVDTRVILSRELHPFRQFLTHFTEK
jgi:hypothetical protein